MSVHERAAQILGWKITDAKSISLLSLREILRTHKSPKARALVAEVDREMRTGRIVIEDEEERVKPYNRKDAAARAKIEKSAGDTWDAEASEREKRAEEYGDTEDGRAAWACAQIAQAKATFARRMARAYERVAKGKPPFDRSGIK